MIAAPTGVRVYLACGNTDMRRGMAGLAVQVQQVLGHDPFGGSVFAFRSRAAVATPQALPHATPLALSASATPTTPIAPRPRFSSIRLQ